MCKIIGKYFPPNIALVAHWCIPPEDGNLFTETCVGFEYISYAFVG
jgi:hypothetical protein